MTTTDVQRRIQKTCEAGYWGRMVAKGQWPEESRFTTIKVPVSALKGCGVTEFTYSMKTAALESAFIGDEETVVRGLCENVSYLWETTFQRDVIKAIKTHCVRQGYCGSMEPHPRAINFRGKPVSPYVVRNGRKYLNPKYKKAAKQEVFFSPETVEFLFLNVSNWAGEVQYRQLYGEPGFYRVIFKYAAKPVRPDEGLVVTYLPPGLKGTLWRWAWEIMHFVP